MICIDSGDYLPTYGAIVLHYNHYYNFRYLKKGL